MLWVSCWHFPRPRQRRPPPGRPREAAGSAGRARPSPGEGGFTVAVLPRALRGVITPALLTFLFRLYFGETYRLSLLVISLTPSSQSLVFPSQPAPPVPGALLRPHSSHPQGRPLGSQTSPAWKVGLGGGEEMVVERRNPAHSSHFTDAEARPRLRPRPGKEGGWCENLAQRGLRKHLAQVLPGTLNSQRGGHQPPGETSHLERLLTWRDFLLCHVRSPPPSPSFVDFSSPPHSSLSQRLSLYPPNSGHVLSLPSCSWGLVDLLPSSVLAAGTQAPRIPLVCLGGLGRGHGWVQSTNSLPEGLIYKYGKTHSHVPTTPES